VVAHVGSNDASGRGVEEILGSFGNLNSGMERVRKASGADLRLSICSVVPRTDRGHRIWSRIDCLNRRLWRFCVSIGAEFEGWCSNRAGLPLTALGGITPPKRLDGWLVGFLSTVGIA
jgi:hypothetical protein